MSKRPMDDPISEIEMLSRLHRAGGLTNTEYAKAKEALLSQTSRMQPKLPSAPKRLPSLKRVLIVAIILLIIAWTTSSKDKPVPISTNHEAERVADSIMMAFNATRSVSTIGETVVNFVEFDTVPGKRDYVAVLRGLPSPKLTARIAFHGTELSEVIAAYVDRAILKLVYRIFLHTNATAIDINVSAFDRETSRTLSVNKSLQVSRPKAIAALNLFGIGSIDEVAGGKEFWGPTFSTLYHRNPNLLVSKLR